jgi:hypothetical protein
MFDAEGIITMPVSASSLSYGSLIFLIMLIEIGSWTSMPVLS